ncbi:uncharacterized protein A4U43_C06F4440 [Asparagus officinalis]|uniref:Uncharacterized protein n=1 Tax=Asparagus officinalis TaxID=4686 RepID=A0A5P1EMV2_ASPOF|nr:uncharacterized protein A4U43_C06F4440 [Asparagus officinalis]
MSPLAAPMTTEMLTLEDPLSQDGIDIGDRNDVSALAGLLHHRDCKPPLRASPGPNRRFEVRAILTPSLVPEVAEAAQPGMSASLKNFLLSIVSGGVVLGAIFGAVIGVSNFDPVKRT